MRKQNLLSKKISKQILSINNLLESYFNSLRRFILDAKRLRFDKNNKVFLVVVSILFLTLTYFLIPTAYNKEFIKKEIKNQIYQKYNLAIKFDFKLTAGACFLKSFAQIEWKVPSHDNPVAEDPKILLTLICISLAALLVNVTARIWLG